jgi:hypothetical protein
MWSPAGGSVISLPATQAQARQRHADRFPLGSQKSHVAVFRRRRATDRRRSGSHNGIAGCRSALQCPRADCIRAVLGDRRVAYEYLPTNGKC